MGVFLEDFFVWFISSLPVLVLLALIGWGIFAIVRSSVRRSRKRKAEKAPKASDKDLPDWVKANANDKDQGASNEEK